MDKVYQISYEIEEIIDDIKEIPDGVKMIKAPDIWEDSRKGQGVVIAIIDTGCQKDHSGLQGRIIGGKNFSDDGTSDDFSDNKGHGTHVAGTIAATNNKDGVAGVAPEARLLILKVFDKDGLARNESVIKAIDYAISYRGLNEEKVRVINMSLGSRYDDLDLHMAVQRAVNDDIVVACAAGNEGDKRGETIEIGYPAAYPESICVGAVDLNKKIADFTNTNDQLDLVAPGVGIKSTWPGENGGKYATLKGTSMATPHVSGALALIINKCEREFERSLTEDEIYAQLIKRTVPLGNKKKEEGNGLLVLTEACSS